MGSRPSKPIVRRAAAMWLSAAFALSACHRTAGTNQEPVDAGPPRTNEVEPNGRPDTAQVLTQSTVVEGNLGADPSSLDEDFYALAPTSPQMVDVFVVSSGADVLLEVYDPDRNRLAAINGDGVGKPERLPNLGVRGRLFLKVASAKRGLGGAYTLTVLFSDPPANAEWEPNHRAADATPSQLGQPIAGITAYAQDEDYFRFDLSPVDAGVAAPPGVAEGANAEDGGGEVGQQLALKIELSGVPGVRHELLVLSAAEAPLFSVKSKEGEPLSLRNVGIRATDQVIFVVVRSAWSGLGKDAKRGFNADQAYTLGVSLEEGGANAELEPNDDVGHATPLPVTGFRDGFLSPKSDVDYYVLRTGGPTLARLQLSGVDRLDLQLSMVEPKEGGNGEVQRLVANDGAVKEPEMLNNVFCPGECYFKVEGAKRKVDGKWVADTENAESPYRLSVITLPDNGGEEREPNAAVDVATPVALGRPIRGTIYPKRDTDYFKLDLSDRPVKTSIRATLTGILKVDLGLYLHRVEEDGKLSLVQTADRAKGDKPEVIRFSADPGLYVLEVKDSRSKESNFQDSYQLTVDEGE